MSDQAVVIWGEILWDRFPEGAQLGGAPSNVAWHLGLAGGWVQLVSRVGDDDAGAPRDRAAVGRCATPTSCRSTPSARPARSRSTIDRRRAALPARPGPRVGAHRVHGRRAGRDRRGRRARVRHAVAAHAGRARRAGARPIARGRHALPQGLRSQPAPHRPRHRRASATRWPRRSRSPTCVKVNDRSSRASRDWLGWRDPIGELRKRPRVVAVTHGAAGSTLIGEARHRRGPRRAGARRAATTSAAATRTSRCSSTA